MMATDQHHERLAELKRELSATIALDDPTDVDGRRLASIASAALWAAEVAHAGRRGTDPGGFREATGDLWEASRRACGDCPRAASRRYATAVLRQLRPSS